MRSEALKPAASHETARATQMQEPRQAASALSWRWMAARSLSALLSAAAIASSTSAPVGAEDSSARGGRGCVLGPAPEPLAPAPEPLALGAGGAVPAGGGCE